MDIAYEKRNRVRFTFTDDIHLLRQVLEINPFTKPSGWRTIAKYMCESTGKCFSHRSVRDHTNILLKYWKKERQQKVGKAVMEEQYCEREYLLQEVYVMKRGAQRTVDVIGLLDREALERDSASSSFEMQYQEEIDIENTPIIIERCIPSKKKAEKLQVNSQLIRSTSHVAKTAKSIVIEHNDSETEMSDEVDILEFREIKQEYDDETTSDNPSQNIKNRMRSEMIESNHERGFSLEEENLQLRRKELEIRERQIKLDEEKFQFEKMLKQKKLELIEFEKMERQRRLELEESRMKIIEKQQNFMMQLLAEKF